MQKYIKLWKDTQFEEEFPICPRCGRQIINPNNNALSRRADIDICEGCGRQEASEDVNAYMSEPNLKFRSKEYNEKYLKEWWLIKTFAATEIENMSKRIKADIENKKNTEEASNEENN